MPRSKPYQPLLLRLLHGTHAFLALAGVITGYWLYDTWDQRFGHLALPSANQDLYDLHAFLGNYFYLFMPFFAFYSLLIGRRRLVQPNSLNQLAQVGKPIWWYTLHRIVNTGLLIASGFALVSGKTVVENELPRGILSDPWYNLHLISWVAILVLFAAHLLMIVKVGGVPLMLSIFDSKVRPQEHPVYRIKKLLSWLRRSSF